MNGKQNKSDITFEFSYDGEEWTTFYSTNIIRISTVLVGPIATDSNTTPEDSTLVWMDVDNIGITDLNQYGSIIIIR